MHRAVLLFLLAGLCLSSLDATAKYLVRDHDLFLVVWARYAGQMLVVTPFAWQRGGPGFWRTQRLGMQLLRSAFLLVATFCFFGGLRYLPLAEASAIIFLAPILVVILSGPLLGERPNRAALDRGRHGFHRHRHPGTTGIRGFSSCGAAVRGRCALATRCIS